MTSKNFFVFMALAGLLFGCAKEREYEEDDNKRLYRLSGAEYEKGQVDMCSLEDPCLWVPSVADTPYNVAASRPFWQGEAKLVVTQLSEDSLKILQVEEDERYRGNINNFSPVAQFSIEHIDYTCQEDQLGECSNVEVEDREKPWQQRRFVRIKDFEVQEKNSLPIQFEELFRAGCYNKSSKQFKNDHKARVENDAINIGIKVGYDANPACVMLREMSDLRYLNFTVDYHYSLVKLSSVADPNYPIVSYPVEDEQSFGFFKTEIKKKTVDNHDHYMGLREFFLNRWSPNKKDLIYYLNEDFYKPEMAQILAATRHAVQTVNNSLTKAGASFQVKLLDGRGKSIGDVRNNFLILVSDPQASGVIGYGPSVVNPKTGEILNARTVMYYGTIKKFVSRAYDDLVDETLAQAQAQPTQETQEKQEQGPEVSPSSDDNHQQDSELGKVVQTQLIRGSGLSPLLEKKIANLDLYRFEQLNRNWSEQVNDMIRMRAGAPLEQLTANDLDREIKKHRLHIERLSKQTFFHASHFNFNAAIAESSLKDFILSTQKYWDDLTEEQRETVMKDLLPKVWIPTLVHEFGHNLGLRHNFYGNVDEDNYYSEEERQSLGITRDVGFSSIMDYTYSTLNELPVMGKYDIAALRFGYARQVTDAQGQAHKIKTTLKEFSTSQADGTIKLKEFKYCSDEHVNTDIMCNRFDQGAKYHEIAKHYVDSYTENYKRRNFRNRRYDFSGRYGDWSYAIGSLYQLFDLRNFFDLYDQYYERGDYSKDPRELSDAQKQNLASIKKASDIAFDGMMNILEEPAYHCLEVFVQDGSIVELGRSAPFVEMVKGSPLANFGITFDIVHGCEILGSYENQGKNPAPGEKRKLYLSFGKYFNNSLDLTIDANQKMQGDTSQIDARGIWVDKVLSSWIVSMKTMSPTTIGAASNRSFLDYPDYRERFDKYMEGILNNKFEKDVELKLNGNTIGKIGMTYSFDEGHLINMSYNYLVNYFFELDSTRSPFKSVMMKQLKKSFSNVARTDLFNPAQQDYNRYDVDKLPLYADVTEYGYEQIIGFRDPQGNLRYRFGIKPFNTTAKSLAAKKEVLDIIESLSPEEKQLLGFAIVQIRQAQDQAQVQVILEALNNDTIAKLVTQNMEVSVDYLTGVLSAESLLTSFLALSEK